MGIFIGQRSPALPEAVAIAIGCSRPVFAIQTVHANRTVDPPELPLKACRETIRALDDRRHQFIHFSRHIDLDEKMLLAQLLYVSEETNLGPHKFLTGTCLPPVQLKLRKDAVYIRGLRSINKLKERGNCSVLEELSQQVRLICHIFEIGNPISNNLSFFAAKESRSLGSIDRFRLYLDQVELIATFPQDVHARQLCA